MMTPDKRTPGPDHPITITPCDQRVRVLIGDTVIAETTRALALQEAQYPEVLYIPREDADAKLLQLSDRVTYCPYKGDASYFTIKANGVALENAIWSYQTPYPAMEQIKGHLAFYPDKVTIQLLAR